MFFGGETMKVPMVDRSQLTPKSLEERWPRKNTLTETNVLDGSGLFGNSELEGLAMFILKYCVKAGGWAPFTTRVASEFSNNMWLTHFVRAGLLVAAGDWYLVTDLYILWLAGHVRESAKEELGQSVRHFVRTALCLNAPFDASVRINFLFGGRLYFVPED